MARAPVRPMQKRGRVMALRPGCSFHQDDQAGSALMPGDYPPDTRRRGAKAGSLWACWQNRPGEQPQRGFSV
jgi:hypothetical protein